MLSKIMTPFFSSYYNTPIDSYFKTVCESGLLLDDDLEILVENFSEKWLPNYRLSLFSKLCIMSALPAVIAGLFYSFHWLIVSPIAFLSVATLVEYESRRYKEKHKTLMEEIVTYCKKIESLWRSINNYLAKRNEKKNTISFIEIFDEDFIDDIIANEKEYYKSLCVYVKTISNYSDVVRDDFERIKDLLLPIMKDEIEINSIEGCISIFIKCRYMHVWQTSKMLTLIIMSLKTSKEVHTIIKKMLPLYLNILENYYKFTKEKFDNIRNCGKRSKQYKIVNKRKMPFSLSTVFNSVVDDVCLLAEKTDALVKMMDDWQLNSEEAQLAIADLKEHAFSAYGSLLNLESTLKPRHKEQLQPLVKPPATDPVQDTQYPTVSYEDDIVVEEENYELFLKDDDEPEETSGSNDDDAFVKTIPGHDLVLESLKNDRRFKEARQRRGSIDNGIKEEEESPAVEEPTEANKEQVIDINETTSLIYERKPVIGLMYLNELRAVAPRFSRKEQVFASCDEIEDNDE